MTNEAPIYNDRDIGSMSIPTSVLIDAMLGSGLPSQAKFGSMSFAARMLSSHPAIENHPDFDPEDVVKSIRDAAWASEQVMRKGDAVSDAELSASLEKASGCFALCRQMARIIIDAAS